MKALNSMIRHLPEVVISFVLLTLVVAISGCQMPTGDSSLEETAMALAIQATLSAQDEEANSENAEQTAVAQSVEQTVAASGPQATDVPPPTATDSPPPTATSEPAEEESSPPPTATTEAQSGGEDFDTWIKSANILLYEDMSNMYSTTRYVKEALDRQGLKYVDVKDAMGTYKNQLLSGGPGGSGWDLIISAKEFRGDISGEFYVYLNDALNDGSSVIIEEWQLDSIGLGKISTILGKCGVEFQDDWAFEPLDHQLLWQVDGSMPIHHQPNEGVSLRNPTGFWSASDLGDLMRLSPGSNATPIWAARVNVDASFLTAVSCLDGRLIIQTYSTHNYGKDRVVKVWENYIYNTLLARYNYLNQ
jgi:hypothetical protein